MKHHIIETTDGFIRILDINSPSYQLNLDSITIKSEAKVHELPDVDCMDCWVIESNNTVSICQDKRRQHVLTQKLALLVTTTDAIFAPVLQRYSQAEILSWPAQEAEALAWIAGNRAQTPTLDAMSSMEDKTEFCQSIVKNAEQFKSMMATVGHSRRIRAQLTSMTLAELEIANPAEMMNALRTSIGA